MLLPKKDSLIRSVTDCDFRRCLVVQMKFAHPPPLLVKAL